eukprot:TRINITY_DN63233_c0_g1_i1.p1 TRINITY_DN63233_c0_g1~~TRINITY_DN63233_c0_g1_i1.p1  ORF type:complete len:725 (-),score=72.26 TRINITY_DN63233_c0_g1_i1:39-2168(-)
MMRLAWVCLLLLLFVATRSALVDDPNPIEYCIIGAGPAGVQLGHFFLSVNRSYHIFERHSVAGSFFSSLAGRGLPKHRRLISFNKRTTGSSDPEFNMRHDWNSLLGTHVSPMTNRSRDLFPLADVLADYIHDFAGVQIEAGRISFGVDVVSIRAVKQEAAVSGALDHLFQVSTSGGARLCEIVIVATGFQKANTLCSDCGKEEDVIGYEALSSGGPWDSFDGKSVIVLGGGNAAYETADALANVAKVQVLARARRLPWKLWHPGDKIEEAEGQRFAMHTHYVGDLRAHRSGIFDSYQLKQPDLIEYISPDDDLFVARCWHGGKLCVWAVEHAVGSSPDNLMLPYIVSLTDSELKSLSRATKQFIEDNGLKKRDFKFRPRVFTSRYRKGAKTSSWHLEVAKHVLVKYPQVFPFLVGEANLSYLLDREPIEPYVGDFVIRCFGWSADLSIFDRATINISTVVKNKYPKITDRYEAIGTRGLFFAGTNTHSLDFRRSAGGFIHGFRYSAQALFRFFEETRHGVAWPFRSFDLHEGKDTTSLLEYIHYRWSAAAGPYQMFGGTLLDGVVFVQDNDETCSADTSCESATPLRGLYYEEMQPSYFHGKFATHYRLVWQFEYGEGFHGPHVLDQGNIGAKAPEHAEDTTFLHPKLMLYPPRTASKGSAKTEQLQVLLEHTVLEDLRFRFENYYLHKLPLADFFGQVLALVRARSRK